MTRRLLFRLAACAVLAAPMPAAAGYTGLQAFGDSLTDRGNLFLLTGGAAPVSPYAAGQLSNGPTWIETFSQRLGLGPTAPSLAGGQVHAYGLGRADNAAPPPPLPPALGAVINLPGQVSAYLGSLGGAAAPADTLFTVWSGSNDMLQTLAAAAFIADPVARAAFVNGAIATSVASVLTQLGELEDAGARDFLVFNLPDLGLTPRLNGDPLSSAAGTAISQAFNTGLAAGLFAFDSLPGVRVFEVDTFALINRAVAAPAAFGLTNASDACLVGGPVNYVATIPGNLVCDAAGLSSSLFFDDLHPSARGHELIAAIALATVPEPAALGLLLFGLAGLAAVRGRGLR